MIETNANANEIVHKHALHSCVPNLTIVLEDSVEKEVEGQAKNTIGDQEKLVLYGFKTARTVIYA